MADLPLDESREVTIRDSSDQTRELLVTADGSLVAYSYEQYLASQNKVFTTNFEVSGIGTTEIPVALFRNPSGSGKTVKLVRFTISNLHQTANTFLRVRTYVGPTVSADGTSLTTGCTHIGQAGPASVAFSSPTASANGTRISQWNVVSSANALPIPLDMLYILDENTQVLITAQADGTNRVLAASLIWAEI